MKFVALIALFAAIPFTIIAFHDPEASVRVVAMVGLGVSVIACCTAVANMPKETA
jgi:hypothetical protein